MKVGIVEAAKLAGKTRQTLYRHIKAGRVSASHNADNALVIDTSELIRAYGSIQLDQSKNVTSVTTSGVTSVTPDVTGELIAAIEGLKREIAALTRTTEKQGALIETLTHQLEHKPTPGKTKPKPPSKKQSGTVHSFADLAKKYTAG